MKKGTMFVVMGLLTVCWLPMSFVLAWETSDPGTITLPKTSEFSVASAARPQQAAKTEDEIVAEIKNRKGKLFQIDVTGASEGFDVNPRTLIIQDKVQFYPQGLIHVIFGSLKLMSKETPMLYRMSDYSLEWVDTEAKAGEKGYELKFESQEGDLYKGVTLTTSGFSMTAKAVKIEDKGDKVLISVKD